MKQCRECKDFKALGKFHKRIQAKDGLKPICKDCHRISNREWRKDNKEAVNKDAQQRRLANLEKCREKERIYRTDNYDKIRDRFLKYNYNIDITQYNNIFESQRGCCSICNAHQSTFKKALAVDHCHKTGKVRGLLCAKCNKGIGHFSDSIEIFENAIIYLKKSKT